MVKLKNTKSEVRLRLKPYNYEKRTVEDIVGSITHRDFSDNLVNTMISGGMTKPGYIFSTPASAGAFRDNFNSKAEKYIGTSAVNLKKFFDGLMAPVIKKENIIAEQLGKLYGIQSNYREELKHFFNSQLANEGVPMDSELTALVKANAQDIAVAMVYIQLQEEYKLLKDLGENKRAQKMIGRQLDRVGNGVLSELDQAKNLIQKSTVGENNLLYQNTKNAETIVKKINKQIYGFTAQGKGIIEEIRVAEIFTRLCQQFSPNVVTKTVVVGSELVSPDKWNNVIAETLQGEIQRNVKTAGEKDKKVSTDIVIEYEVPQVGTISLSIDVKSTIYDRYQKGSKSFELDKVLPGQSDITKGAFIALISDVNVRESAGKFTGSLKALRVIMPKVMEQNSFIESYFPELNSKNYPNFITIDSKVYWYSDLLKSITNNLTDFSSNGFYQYAITLKGTESIVAASTQASKLLALKRKLLRRKIALRMKDYNSRYDYLMKNPELNALLSSYWASTKGLSVDISTKFKMQ